MIMNINDLIQTESLSKTEENIILDVFSNSVVKKYLRIMGQNDLSELALLSITERDDSVVAKKHALVQGKLSVISTLLSITKS